jgi:hypothetical protein
MSSRTRMRPPLAATAAVAFLSVAGFASEASAHVKWFCAFDVAGQPRGLENVLCADFEGLVGLAVLVLILGCLVDGTALGDAVLRALDRVTGPIRANQDILIRAVGGFFFVTLWSMEGILLTPELKTVFLGLAAYLVLVGLQRDLLGLRPLDVARYSAAVTLMWASIEKWAYPEWSFPLFIEHPAVTMGFDGEFFMRAAGVIEFTLAFALLWTPLVRRVSAIVLAAMFVAATFEFGKIDVIGHAPIVVVLVAIAGDDLALVQRTRRFAAAVPVAYSVALAGFLTAYYVAHTWLFGTQIL